MEGDVALAEECRGVRLVAVERLAAADEVERAQRSGRRAARRATRQRVGSTGAVRGVRGGAINRLRVALRRTNVQVHLQWRTAAAAAAIGQLGCNVQWKRRQTRCNSDPRSHPRLWRPAPLLTLFASMGTPA